MPRSRHIGGGIESLFLVFNDMFLIYKQQGTIISCSLNKLDVKNHWVLRDLENPQALSSGPSSFSGPTAQGL